VAKLSAAEVRMTLRVRQGTVESIGHRMKMGEIEVVVDLTAATRDMGAQKEFGVVLTQENVTGLPLGAHVMQLRPDGVDVTVVQLVSKRLNVMPRLAGGPAAGFVIGDKPYVQPNKVQVWGSKPVLDSVESIYTKPIDIAGITDETNRTFPWLVPVDQTLPGPDGKPMTVRCDESVWVYLSVGREVAKKTIERVPVRVLGQPGYPYTVKLKDEHVSLKVKGPKHVVDKLGPGDVVAYVAVADLRPAAAPYQQPLVCRLPPGIELDQPAIRVDVDVSLPHPENKLQ